jgi:hypothetical protein
MAKKKSNGKSKSESESESKGKGNKLPIIAAVVVALMAGGYFVSQSSSRGSEQGDYAETVKGGTVPVTAGLIETRPLMAPNRFKGRVSEVYKWAAEIPEVFDSLYCYCGCKENPRFKHKTLLTCYTDTHASKCGICLKEGQMAWELTKKGMSPTEIRGEVDKYYAKLKRSRVF